MQCFRLYINKTTSTKNLRDIHQFEFWFESELKLLSLVLRETFYRNTTYDKQASAKNICQVYVVSRKRSKDLRPKLVVRNFCNIYHVKIGHGCSKTSYKICHHHQVNTSINLSKISILFSIQQEILKWAPLPFTVYKHQTQQEKKEEVRNRITYTCIGDKFHPSPHHLFHSHPPRTLPRHSLSLRAPSPFWE